MTGLHWTLQESARLAWELDEHGDEARAGRELHRSAFAIGQRRRHLGIAPVTRTGYTIVGLGHLFAVNESTAARWLHAGAFNPTWRVGRSRRRVVPREAVEEFLSDRAWWHEWEPSQLTDPDLREIARDERGSLRFLTLADVGTIYGLTPPAVLTRIRRGLLPALWCRTTRGGAWVIPSDELPPVDPAPPRRPIVCRRFTPDEDRFLEEWRPYQPCSALGAALERAPNSVIRRCQLLALDGPKLAPTERGCSRRYHADDADAMIPPEEDDVSGETDHDPC